MQFGFLLVCVVLAALAYTLGTLQTAMYYRRKPIQNPTVHAPQRLLPLLDHPASSV